MKQSATYTKPTLQFYWLSVLVFLCVSLLTCRLFGFNGLYGQDSHEYLRYTNALRLYLTGGPDAGNFFWPILYPLAGALLSFILPVKISLQVISIISASVCYVYFGKTLNLIYPSGTQRQRFAIVCLLCSPFFLRASVLAMSDMFCCAILSATYFHLFKADQQQNKNSLFIALIFSVFIIQIRYAAIILLLPILPVLFKFIKKRFSIIFFVIASILLALTPSLFIRPEINLGFINHPWIANWSPLNLLQQNFNNADSVLHYSFPNIVYILSIFVYPGFCFFTPILIWFTIKKQPLVSKWWIASIILYLIFLGGIPFQNMRFLILVFPIILLTLYPGFESGFDLLKNRTARLVILFLIIIIQSGLTYRAIRPFYRYQQEEVKIASTLKQFPITTVYTFAIDGALRTYDVQHEIINIWSLTDPMLKTGSFFLYNPTRFKENYSSKPAGILFNDLIKQQRLIKIKEIANGWELYKIK